MLDVSCKFCESALNSSTVIKFSSIDYTHDVNIFVNTTHM